MEEKLMSKKTWFQLALMTVFLMYCGYQVSLLAIKGATFWAYTFAVIVGLVAMLAWHVIFTNYKAHITSHVEEKAAHEMESAKIPVPTPSKTEETS